MLNVPINTIETIEVQITTHVMFLALIPSHYCSSKTLYSTYIHSYI